MKIGKIETIWSVMGHSHNPKGGGQIRSRDQEISGKRSKVSDFFVVKLV